MKLSSLKYMSESIHQSIQSIQSNPIHSIPFHSIPSRCFCKQHTRRRGGCSKQFHCSLQIPPWNKECSHGFQHFPSIALGLRAPNVTCHSQQWVGLGYSLSICLSIFQHKSTCHVLSTTPQCILDIRWLIKEVQTNEQRKNETNKQIIWYTIQKKEQVFPPYFSVTGFGVPLDVM